MTSSCPVCQLETEAQKARDYGDKKLVRCPRCGFFEISGTAIAMLEKRAAGDRLANARLSHAIRSSGLGGAYLVVNSTNLDRLSSQPLPKIKRQVENLICWLAIKLRGDHFGDVQCPDLAVLSGVVGAVDGHGVEQLVEYAESSGLLRSNPGKGSLGLTPVAWEKVEALLDPEVEENEESMTAVSPETIVKANCNTCGGERDAFSRARHKVDGNDGEVSWSDTYEVLECCGCHEISVRRESWFSEWDELEHDAITGELRHVKGLQIDCWPPPTKRKKPDWSDKLNDRSLRDVMGEVYAALDAGLLVLASIGTRTLLDRAMTLCVGDVGGFAQTLNKMEQSGHIGPHDKAILEIITDAGSASAHRAYAPQPEDLNQIVDVVENFLHREFILKDVAKQIRQVTPPRISPRKGKKP